MKRARTVVVPISAIAIASLLIVARGTHTRSAHAQGMQLVRDFFGEADEEVTAVTAVPAGMTCGGLSVGSGLTVQTSEPPGGFTGACLMSRPYGGGVPSVCYSPPGATYTINAWGPTTQCSIPAANVVQPDSHVNVDQNAGTVSRQSNTRTRTLETCVPHLGAPDPRCSSAPSWLTVPTPDQVNADCPCGTILVSHSCCTQLGAAMHSDGTTATGSVYFATGD